jgi:peptidoglycan/LPS O-acetylase OafA/YrhL
MQTGKVQYLEGLRGIAAIQVVLLHFVSGFLPDIAQYAWAPLHVLYDGHTAVYVFFLISGAVLTPSFARQGAFVAKAIKRVVRLVIPVAAAAVVAMLLLALWPDAHMQAAALTGSAWLAMDSSGPPTLAHLAREIGLDSLLLGYREATLFAPWAERLPLMETSLDAPFWSLHLELYGSLLVLCLVWLRTRSIWLHRAAVAATALLFGMHPMFLFVMGHLMQPRPFARNGGGIARGLLGALLLLFGIALCANKDWESLDMLRLWLGRIVILAPPNLFQFQSQLAALALYFGVLLCHWVWPLLESGPCRSLGRLSFSIYLLHFPILFTLACLIFVNASIVMAHGAAVAGVFVLFIGVTLIAAMLFERWIDRPAVALSRLVGSMRVLAA